MQIVHATGAHIADRHDDVACLQAGDGGRASGFDGCCQHAGGRRELIGVRQPCGIGTVCPVTPMTLRRTRPSRRSAEATNCAVLLAMANDEPLRRHDHRGIDPDHHAVGA